MQASWPRSGLDSLVQVPTVLSSTQHITRPLRFFERRSPLKSSRSSSNTLNGCTDIGTTLKMLRICSYSLSIYLWISSQVGMTKMMSYQAKLTMKPRQRRQVVVALHATRRPSPKLKLANPTSRVRRNPWLVRAE